MTKETNVTEEYLELAKPNHGRITYEKGFIIDSHPNEVSMAKWIHHLFGGDIVLLAETQAVYMGKRADYRWRNQLWELKQTTSCKGVDSALRKALQQIRANPGGVILDFKKNKIQIEQIKKAVRIRLKKSCRFTVDIMIIQNKEVVEILRFSR